MPRDWLLERFFATALGNPFPSGRKMPALSMLSMNLEGSFRQQPKSCLKGSSKSMPQAVNFVSRVAFFARECSVGAEPVVLAWFVRPEFSSYVWFVGLEPSLLVSGFPCVVRGSKSLVVVVRTRGHC